MMESFAETAAIGLRAGGEGGGASAPTPTSAPSCLACFPFFNRCVRDISSSTPTRKNFQSGLDLPLAGAVHFSPCHWLVAHAAGSGCVSHSGCCSCKKKQDLRGPSRHRDHCQIYHRCLAVAALPVPLSRYVDRVTPLQRCWFPVVANVCSI